MGLSQKSRTVTTQKVNSHVLAGTYPKEADMLLEMEAVAAVFKKYDVTVYRPDVLENYNQIFSRDIAFCIEDKLIKANILPDREKEFEAIGHVLAQIDPKISSNFQKNAMLKGAM